MMDTEQLKKIIAAGMACEGLNVEGDGQHFEAIIVSSEFVGKAASSVSSGSTRYSNPILTAANCTPCR